MLHVDTIYSMTNHDTVQITIDERGCRALLSAVLFTLDKWTGQGDIDQEQLICLKPFLQGAVLEFDFAKDMG